MIVYVTTRLGWRAIAESLPHLPRDLRRSFRLTTYGDLQKRIWLPLATYIFADIERLAPKTAERAACVWDALASSREPVRLFNHPTRSLSRAKLLQTLFRAGLSAFSVSLWFDLLPPCRVSGFPFPCYWHKIHRI
ncbi:MAG: hypothetical protein WD044_08695 [Dongiaceae bacterium]